MFLETLLVIIFPPIAFPIPPTYMDEHEAAMKEVHAFVERHRRIFMCETFALTRTRAYKECPQLVSAGIAKYMPNSLQSLTLLINAFHKSNEAVELVSEA